jgi:hypothetical protein
VYPASLFASMAASTWPGGRRTSRGWNECTPEVVNLCHASHGTVTKAVTYQPFTLRQSFYSVFFNGLRESPKFMQTGEVPIPICIFLRIRKIYPPLSTGIVDEIAVDRLR